MVTTGLVTAQELQRFGRDGYLLKRGLFGAAECEQMVAHFTALRERRDVPGCFHVTTGDDPLLAWPRMMQPHRVDALSRELLLDDRLFGVVGELLGQGALAAQSMWYWKPPGARGQALHQDDFYLRTQPGNCLAAWLSVDPADRENGCLRVVPGTHVTPLQCPHTADERTSFSAHEVTIADEREVAYVEMGAGDVLYFPGRLIHGSLPNASADRFRKSFICHYVPAGSAECARGYQPLLDAAGAEVLIGEPGPDSDPCGGPEFAAT